MCNFSVTAGGFAFRLDMAWPSAKVAVEYDGEEHHGPDRTGHDNWRRGLLAADGWLVIVVRKEDLRALDQVALAVQHALATRTPSGRSRTR